MSSFPEYGPVARAKYDVVITGAGISQSAPSSVPSGDELMGRAWARLIDHLSPDQRTVLEPVTRRLHAETPPIWLEPLAQLLLDHSGNFGLVSSIYSEVSTQRFNDNHAGLAGLDALQVTVNMDTLLEAAGAEAWHLHGRWDEPETIVSTVRQYSDGLPQQTQNDLLEALTDACVLVIGYSGRDVDVIPILGRSKPSLLHWMHYGDSDLSPQAQQLRSDLKGVMQVFSGGASDVLTTLPKSRAPAPQTIASTSVSDAFEHLPDAFRLLCAAAVALEVGEGASTILLLNNTRLAGPAEITRRKLLSRAYSRTGYPKAALRSLIQRPTDLGTLVAWPRTLNEVAATLPFAGHPRIGYALNRALLLTRSATSARVRLARSSQKAGRLRAANRAIASICATENLHRVIGEHGRVDALDLLADSQKTLGLYVDAAKSAAKAVSLLHYANTSQRGSALRRLAEIAHFAGIDSVQTSPDSETKTPASILEAVYSEALSHSDKSLMFWSAATRADVANSVSARSARHWLDLADDAMPNRTGGAAIYLSLLEIEATKVWHSADEAAWEASKLVSDLDSDPSGNRLERLVAHSVLAECELARGEFKAARHRFTVVARGASRTGMDALAGRALLLRDTIAGLDLTGLAKQFDEAGWHREETAVGCSASELSRRPWPILL